MNSIRTPLRAGEVGPAVVDLQEALLFLIDRKVIQALEPPSEPTSGDLRRLAESITSEHAQSTFDKATQELVGIFQKQRQLSSTGEVDEDTATSMNALLVELGVDLLNEEIWTVRGRVTLVGKPQADILVEAFDRDLRKRQPLGSNRTKSDGTYVISYRQADFAEAERRDEPTPWLVVEATPPNDRPKLTIERARGVRRDEVVDLLFEPPSTREFVEISHAVVPLLAGQDKENLPLPPWELGDDDLGFLTTETGLDRERLRLWILAAKTARQVVLLGSPPEPLEGRVISDDDSLEWLAFYGWYRDGQPTTFEELIGNQTTVLMQSLARSISDGRIPELTQEQLKRIEQALNTRRVTEALKPAPEGQAASLGTMLSLVNGAWLTTEVQQQIAPVLIEVPVESEEFLERLKEHVPELQPRLDLRRTLRLGELTRRHIPMIKALQPKADTSQDDTLRGLVSIEPDRWLELAYDQGVPAAYPRTPEDYSRQMELEVERQAPTAALAQRLKTDQYLGSSPSYSSLIPILQKHAEFDMLNGNIDELAKSAELNPEQKTSLRRLQHLKRLGAQWSEASTLLERGINSVDAIVELGPAGFKAELREVMIEERIETIYSHSRARHNASVGLMGYLQPLLFTSSQFVLQTKAETEEMRAKIDQFPTLRELFGALESCACDECLSVLSPAAYLVDLLKFVGANSAAADELKRRRPDLYDLKLSCDNSQIEVLHIDLVNEILENKVALPLEVSLPQGVSAESELRRVPLGAVVRDTLQQTVLETLGELSATEEISAYRHPRLAFGRSFWTVTDQHRRWVLEAAPERLRLQSSAYDSDVDLNGLDITDVLASLNQGIVPASLRTRLEQALIQTQRLAMPVSVENFAIVQNTGNRWTVKFSLVGTAYIVKEEGTLVLRTDSPQGAVEDKRIYSLATLDASKVTFDNGEIAPVVRIRNPPQTAKLSIVPQNGGGWTYRSSHSAQMSYQPPLIVRGLTYQSTARGEDLLARPQNRNPLAYLRLNGPEVRFPWSLPYDANLFATRTLLAKAGSPRLELMDLLSVPNSFSAPMSLVREVLGISEAEAARICTPSPGNILWSVWGLRQVTPGVGFYAVFDTFEDRETTGTALALLGRVSVLMQQARVRFVELRQLLASTWVNPDGVAITPDHLCDPVKISVAVSEGLLDRLHRFVRLWRAIGWQIWELDQALRNPVIAADTRQDGTIGDNTLRNLADLKSLNSRLDLPIEVLLTWFSRRFTNEPHVVEGKGELLEVRSLYARLFVDRRLNVIADPDLAFAKVDAAQPPTVEPPTGQPPIAQPPVALPPGGVPLTGQTSVRLIQKARLFAAAFGVGESGLGDLINSDIDATAVSARKYLTNGNLVWIYRNVLLMKACRFSMEEYQAAWRVRADTPPRPEVAPFASPGALLAFLDDAERVRRGGTTWRVLEYILRGAGEEDTAFSTAQAAAILGAIQRSLSTGPEPTTSVSHFGLSEAAVNGPGRDPRLTQPPASADERWLRWGLKRSETGPGWTVANPDNGAMDPILKGSPLALLKRLPVLAQQLQVTIGEARGLLQTRFVVPDGATELSISDPGETVTNLSAVHLDRLERLAALWRRTGLSIRELDLMTRAVAVTNPADPLTDNLLALVEQGRALATLRDRLRVPLDTVIAWKSGLGGRRYTKYDLAQNAMVPDPSVFDRLFGSIVGLGLNSTRDKLEIEDTPPNQTPTWSELFSDMAPKLGVPKSELAFLIDSGLVPGDVTLVNLNTIHRIVTLSSALGSSTQDLHRLAQRFSRIQGNDWASSPTMMLRFADAALRERQRVPLVTSLLASAFQLDSDIARDLLWEGLTVSKGNNQISAMEMLLDSVLLNSSAVIDSAALGNTPEFAVLVRLYKLRLLNVSWKATPTELRWLSKGPQAAALFTTLSVNALPVSATDSPVPFDDWRRTTSLFDLAHSTSAMSALLEGYPKALGAAKTPEELNAAFEFLGLAHGIPKATAASFVAGFAKLLGLDVPSTGPNPAVQLDPLNVARLLTLLGRALRLGLDAEAFSKLITDPTSDDSVAIARAVLRSRFGEATWAKTLREANDEIRQTERDRLVDHLVAAEGVRDAEALYERYLINVKMGACMITTRLLQSIAAVQLFVQRCFLNSEQPNVPADAIPNRERWEWMRNYRVWEANRKVFLYPENWLHPDLRDDRSEIFRAFESALTQSEPSHENAVNAVNAYLDSLLGISEITVMGIYEDIQNVSDRSEVTRPTDWRSPESVDGSDSQNAWHALYLVGRTSNPPYSFYWRKSIQMGTQAIRWTGWERIDQDLSGDHIIPFVLGGELHIAWPIIKEIEINKKPAYDVQLAWSKKTSTHWTARRNSRESVRIEKLFNRDERSMFAFRCVTLPNSNGASIEVLVASDPQTITIPHPINEAILTPWRQSDPANQDKYWRLRIDAHSYVTFTNGRVGIAPLNYRIYGIRWESDPNKITGYQLGQAEDSIQVSELFPFEIEIFGPIKLELQASAFGQLTKRINVPLIQAIALRGGSAAIRVNFALDGIDDPESSRAVEKAPLPMVSVGHYSLEPGRELKWEPFQASMKIEPIQNAFFFSSGWQEIAAGGISHFRPGFSEPMFVLLTSSALNGQVRGFYVEEGNQRMIARVNETSGQVLDARPCGYADAAYYLRRAAISPGHLFELATQRKGENTWFGVNSITNWIGTEGIGKTLSEDETSLGFDLSMPNASYNWEVFYHLPIAAGMFLSRQHRRDDARRWFHYVFDPTTNDPSSGRERFWRFLPFRNANAPVSMTRLLEVLADRNAPAEVKGRVQHQIAAWLADPFNPFAVARLRPSAFEWYTVIAYVKNLIAWGDQMFRRDTRESIDEATLLYVLAAKILGRRPEHIAPRGAPQAPLSYRELESRWDELGNVWLSLADTPLVHAWISFLQWLANYGVNNSQSIQDQITQLSSIGSLYFCVPPNQDILDLWDIVEDRLFKIRHCQNIEGVRRELPFFEPPIDPELLIRARAAGLDLAGVLADRFAPLPHHRFQVLLQKANEFCSEVRTFGAALLSAVEKKEVEQLTLLRSRQELEMLRLVEKVRADQVKEADANIEALEKTRRSMVTRFAFFQRQLGNGDLTFDATGAPIVEQALMTQVQESGAPGDFRTLALIQAEIDQVSRLQDAHVWSMVSGGIKAGAGSAHLVAMIPYANTYANALGFALTQIGEGLGLIATNASFWERRASLISTWQRRRDEWVQQSKMAAEEIRQVDKQIVALQIRKAMAEKELENQRKQIEFATTVDDFLRRLKFTSESLYAWMEGQLAGLHFSAYQLAYDLARRAERSFRFELGDEGASFVQFGHWDGLRKGLLAGERLANDLRRMEAAYFNQNRRELEITKHISLRQIDAEALLELRQGGKCEFELPEPFFDLDFPGHYFRRIKSVSVSVPCVVGPYAGVSGTLTLLSSQVREKPLSSGDYTDEANYRASFLPVQSIATSSGQNDSGLFELNFRDERYLPFEGAGAISRWRLDLPKEFRAFDYKSISDVILHLRYTARDGGEGLASKAKSNLTTRLNELTRAQSSTVGLAELLSLSQDFGTEWFRFKQQKDTLILEIAERFFPYLFRNRVKPKSAILIWSDGEAAMTAETPASPTKLPMTYRVEASAIPESVSDASLIVTYEI